MATLTEYLTSIANAIRTKKGTTETINAQNFASEIESIEGGSGGATLIFNDGQGTAIPYDSTTIIENIYLNINLPKEEVVTLFQNNINLYPDGFVVILYSENAMLVFVAEGDIYVIGEFLNNITYFAYDSTGQGQDIENIGFSGWNPDFNGVIACNSTNEKAVANNFGSQQVNEALKTLFSIIPFEKEIIELSGDYKAKTIDETINVVENGTTTLSYLSDFDTNKEILDNVDIVFNVEIPNVAQILIDKLGGSYLFYEATLLSDDDLEVFFSSVSTSNVTEMNHMFYNCYSISTIPLFDTSNVTKMGQMFSGCIRLTTLPLFDTSNVTSMNHMFYSCYNLTTIPLLDTSKVQQMQGMFLECSRLTTIPLLDTSSARYMQKTFSGCKSLTTIPQFNTSNVTDMSEMFRTCSNLTTIPLLDTSKVTDMNNMFNNCINLTTIPAFDVSNVTKLQSMFNSCTKLKSILMTGMKVFFDISASTQFEASDLVVILNNLSTVTSTTTLTMGSTNLAKLTDEEKAIATNKGWTLA